MQVDDNNVDDNKLL